MIKNKSRFLIAGILMAVLSMLMTAEPAFAYHASITWGSQHNVEVNYELPAMHYTTSYINSQFTAQSYVWAAQDAFNVNGMTNATIVYSTTNYIQQSSTYDFNTNFHVGHFYPSTEQYSGWQLVGWTYDPETYEWYPIFEWVETGPTEHYNYYADYLYDESVSQAIRDSVLCYYGGSKERFTFIWTCSNAALMDLDNDNIGDTYGYIDPLNTGLVGMPYAWTGITTMSQNGYASPDSSNYCYIGFENLSRDLTNNVEFGAYNHNYGDFVRYFYYHAATEHHSIITSLNEATRDASNNNLTYFWQTDLYNGYYEVNEQGNFSCRMRVFGNGNLVLPS